MGDAPTSQTAAGKPADGKTAPATGAIDGTGPVTRPVIKVVVVLILVLAMLIPLLLVQEVIAERQSRYRTVVAEIGEQWGRAQRFDGPVLAIPYRLTVPDRDGQPVRVDRTAFLLPDRYAVRAEATPEVRRRGMFEAVVYTTDLTVEGAFDLPPPESWAEPDAEILWQNARLVAGISDPRSIRDGVSLQWRDGQTLQLRPGTHPELGRWMTTGSFAEIPGLRDAPAGQPLSFRLSLRVNGSDQLSFLPLGRENQVVVASSWPDPSFIGNFLPERRNISAAGFDATWSVSYFGRSYPQLWTTTSAADSLAYDIAQSSFGVRFFQPVGAYHQTERSAKYGILFIVFTFTVFFLFEVGAGLRIHVFQYGLVGLSLCVFYLLLLSIAEQIGFGPAYAIGAAAVIFQILFYSFRMVGGWPRTLILGALLGGLYSALYILMQLEDLALLVGSIGLFLALMAIMAFTRNIDWYAMQRPATHALWPPPPRPEGAAAQPVP